jgi:hypothetical protein
MSSTPQQKWRSKQEPNISTRMEPEQPVVLRQATWMNYESSNKADRHSAGCTVKVHVVKKKITTLPDNID